MLNSCAKLLQLLYVCAKFVTLQPQLLITISIILIYRIMEQQKRYGHFDDQHREYVITDPQTPWPWINYLGNEDFFSLISNTAGGYSFYKDAKFRRRY